MDHFLSIFHTLRESYDTEKSDGPEMGHLVSILAQKDVFVNFRMFGQFNLSNFADAVGIEPALYFD